MNTIKKPKIIIDTDPGHDDALALLLLLKSNQFDIQAITTVAGNATIEKVTRNAQAIVNLVQQRIPVVSGLPSPLTRKLITAVVHGESGLDGFDTSRTQFQLTGVAPQKIVEIARQSPGQVSLLCLGPLSNVAQAIKLDPELPNLIQKIVIMGGAIDVPGNKNRVAEFNFFVDPEAAEVVFSANVQKVLVPLDLCNTVVLQVNEFKRVKNTALQKILFPMMQHFLASLATDEGTEGILVYDALAAYYLLNPNAFVLEPMSIVIETKGEFTSGMSVAERRKYKQVEPNVQVAQELNQDQFKKDLLSIIGR